MSKADFLMRIRAERVEVQNQRTRLHAFLVGIGKDLACPHHTDLMQMQLQVQDLYLEILARRVNLLEGAPS